VEERPNLVLVVSDTFRRDHLGAYGNEAIRTPNLDRLASQAAVFDYHLAASFPTMPARADLLSGRFSFAFMGWEPLPRELDTLPALLSAAGYLTVGVVDTPFFVRDGYGYDRGFDDFIWVRGQGDDTRPAERLDARLTWVREADRMVARTVTAAEEWLERHYREPFFLYVDTWDPHEPWDAPAYYTELYLPGYDGRALYPAYGRWQEAGLTEDDVRLAHATYCGEVTMVDRWLGRLLEKLEVLGVADRTYLIFTSDHGFYFGEHGYFGKAEWVHDPGAELSEDARVPEWFSRSWLLTIDRSPLYQELTRIPLLVRGPGVVPGRRRALTTAPDITATVLDLAGAEVPQSMQGRSLRALLEGSEGEHRPFCVTSWPLYFAEGELTSAIDGRTRRIASLMPITIATRSHSLLFSGPEEPPELYDLERDPGENENVWEEERDQGERLLAAAVRFLERCGASEEHLRPRREALRAFVRP
jgi:arylsulfatase A-like enzyme